MVWDRETTELTDKWNFAQQPTYCYKHMVYIS